MGEKNKHVDWGNEYKLCYSVESYFFRYNNYNKYLESGNLFIKKSSFGVLTDKEIKEEIDWWFKQCVGAYCVFNK